MLCRLTKHIIIQVVAEVMVLFAVSSLHICRTGAERRKADFPLSASAPKGLSHHEAYGVSHFP